MGRRARFWLENPSIQVHSTEIPVNTRILGSSRGMGTEKTYMALNKLNYQMVV